MIIISNYDVQPFLKDGVFFAHPELQSTSDKVNSKLLIALREKFTKFLSWSLNCQSRTVNRPYKCFGKIKWLAEKRVKAKKEIFKEKIIFIEIV